MEQSIFFAASLFFAGAVVFLGAVLLLYLLIRRLFKRVDELDTFIRASANAPVYAMVEDARQREERPPPAPRETMIVD